MNDSITQTSKCAPDIPSLARSEFFCGLAFDEIKTLLKTIPNNIEFYQEGEVIAAPGQIQNRIGIVLEGLVSGTACNNYQKNELLGLTVATSAKQISPFFVTAVRESAILWFNIDDVMQGDFPPAIFRQIMRNLLAASANENLRLIIKTKVLAEHEIRERVVTFLTIIDEKRDAGAVDINMNQNEFAKYLCVNRSKLSTALNKLRKEGVLEYSRNIYKLLKR